MRKDGTLNPTDQVPIRPDTIGTIIGTTAGVSVAFDWPSGVGLVTFAGNVPFIVNFASANAAVPTTNSSGTTLSSGLNEFVPTAVTRQISTGDSTGYSVAFPTSGFVTASFWQK